MRATSKFDWILEFPIDPLFFSLVPVICVPVIESPVTYESSIVSPAPTTDESSLVASPTPWIRRGVIFSVFVLGLAGVGLDWWWALPDDEVSQYVGRQSCIECHQPQADLFHGSHHDLAMDLATEESVLADFGDVELSHYGITSRMFREGEKFMIHTEGPDGKMADFQIKYVFGVEPLQQYMVEFDRTADMKPDEIGRLQVLRVSWDTKQKRWFYLPPPDVDEKLDPDDDLHWTSVAQRWNTMCAECHSTNLKKNFDPHQGRYRTTFSEIDVSCEACHGPGSTHVKLAKAASLFWDRKRGYGLAKLKTVSSKPQIDTCGQCHSRRRLLHPQYHAGRDYYDYFANELLMEDTYHADGQIKDEVYVLGSYLQSKMYHKGIKCTDCHDPHTARLKHTGNQVCVSCHQHSAGKYDTPAHHHHQVNSTGASCVECHMPETTYMEVDPRRDHSLRVPRPDLSVTLGTPNACTRCHLDQAQISDSKRSTLKQYADWVRVAAEGDEQVRSELRRLDQWAADAVRQWYGEKQYDDTAVLAFHAAREATPDSPKRLAEVVNRRQLPAIYRATALAELAASPIAAMDESTVEGVEKLLQDSDPQVRAAAIRRLEPAFPTIREVLQPQQVEELASQLRRPASTIAKALVDPSRFVRVEAARVLARIQPAVRDRCIGRKERAAFAHAIDEYIAGIMMMNDRAAAHMNLGIIYEDLWRDQDARKAYELAIKVEQGVTGPRSNLAELLERIASRSTQQDAEKWVQRAAQLRREELDLLRRDARLAPDNAPIQHRLGLSLYLQGQREEAELALVRAHELEPQNEQFVLVLTLFYQQIGNLEKAREFGRLLFELAPRNPRYQEIYQQLFAPDASRPAPGPARTP